MTVLTGFLVVLVGLFWFVVTKGKQLALKYAWVVAPYLTNNPKEPGKFYAFTTCEQGQIKVIVQGEKVVGYIMNMPEKSLRRNRKEKPSDPELTINNAAFADVIPEPADTEEEDLFYIWKDDKYLPWRLHTYKKCGRVFVGIPPWQEVAHRPFRSAKLSEDGQSITYYEGLTDHMRVKEFARPFIAAAVETKENLKIKVGVEIMFVTTNAFKQWFNVNRFEERLDNIVPARIQEFVKTQSIEAILTAEEGNKRAIEEYLVGTPDGTKPGVLNEFLSDYGLKATRAHVFELEPNLSDDERDALTAEWRAQKRKAARKHDAEADADYLKKTSDPLKDNDGLVRVEVAKAAASGKGTTTIIDRGGGGTTDHAMLAELQRIRGSKGGDSK